MSDVVTITGSCHCGNVRFSLEWPAPCREILTRSCNCTFCRKHGGVWTSHREAKLEARVDEAALISKYRFGTETADFYVCVRCGVVPFVVSEIENSDYAVVNINTFDASDAVTFSSSSTDFSGEKTGDRLSRRMQNWIQHVDISVPGA